MPEYKCECCNYKTHIKTQFDTHNLTKKHLKNIDNNTEPITPKTDKTEIQELKDMVILLCAKVTDLEASLQECKEIIKKNNEKPPTYEAPPTPPPSPAPQVIYVSPEPEPKHEPEPKKETCNPMYIAKKLDEDPDNKDILPIDDFFKIANEEVNFDFDDINDLKDVGKKYAIDKIMNFVKNNKKILPFRYQKSSWYIKGNNGWEKEIIQSNKNCKTGTSDYNFSIIVIKFIFIFANRINKYFDNKYGGNYAYMSDGEYARITSEVLSRESYRNSDILKSIGHFC